MKVPTLPECDELFERYQVPRTVRVHCETVCKAASFLAEKLLYQGYKLDLNIIKSFAFLHDFMKVVVIKKLGEPPYIYPPTKEEIEMHQKLRQEYGGLSETYVAFLILKDQYPEFARLFLELEQLTRNPSTKVREETRFIHYVDWRVLGNKIVPLRERMSYIYQRYSPWIEKHLDWEEAKKEQRKYEQKIFNYLSFKPEQLALQMESLCK